MSAAARGTPASVHDRLTIDARTHGARGDGRAIDSDPLNDAILRLSAAGGGTLRLSRGRYRCFTLRLASRVAIVLDAGAVIEAADPARHGGRYDLPEDNPHDVYQDFGHSHWRNSLIHGIGVEDVAILGPGLIDGCGLTPHGPGARWAPGTGSHPETMRGMSAARLHDLEPDRAAMRGLANKAIALRDARRVRIADLTIVDGGHFAILATGVDDLAIERVTIDTDRDGIDLDCVRDARVVDCVVNSPNDDAIVLKSSLALGGPRACERVVIAGCRVSGFDRGTLLDGTRATTQAFAPDLDRVTGRIKLGTESNGGFRDVTIRDCTFDHCRGLALETVDGGVLEDVTVRGLVMRDVTTAPLFLRLGDRRRGPPGTPRSVMRRIDIADVVASGIDPRFAATIAGLPEAPIEDVRLADVGLSYRGGGTAEDAARIVPELRDAYPEPSMFGVLPAWGLFARSVRGLDVTRLTLATETPDARPPVRLDRVTDVRIAESPLWPDGV